MRDPKLLADAERVCLHLLARRGAQIDRGYDTTHDDEHSDGGIVTNAAWGVAARLSKAAAYQNADDPARREHLIVAASLLVAEVERIDRARKRRLIQHEITAALDPAVSQSAAELATARREGMEKAAKIADSCGADWTKSSRGKFVETKWDYESRADAADEIAAYIRAAAKEVKP